MKALVIGAGGFVGGYLINELLSRGYEVCATKLPNENIFLYGGAKGDFKTAELDILQQDKIEALLDDERPDCIFHLAAQSSVAVSWEKPALTADINIKGCINLLEASRAAKQCPRILLIGSSEEYGHAANRSTAVDESVPCDPASIYAVSKLTQNMIGRLYCQAYGMEIVSVRAFNHIGPGQLPQFVTADFCRQAAMICKGLQEPVIRVGNLSAKRDFTDVRDIVRAYAELAVKGKGGETYNVGSGKAVEIREILDRICRLSEKEISVETDKARFRPVDVPYIAADISKLVRDTDWQPEVELDRSLTDILEYFSNNI